MIRSGNLARFTPTEVDEFRQIGIDLGNVKHQNDIEREMSRWAHTLADERFALLEKIASTMAKAKGVRLPPKLNVAPFADSSQYRDPFVGDAFEVTKIVSLDLA
jgi:hypothetical protein